MPPRRDPDFVFPPEITQLIQRQNALMQLLVQNQGNANNNNANNNNPPPVDNLARFLRLQPPVFSSSIEPIVADDWLRRIGRELTTAGYTDAEKVRFCRTPTGWTCSSMVGEFHNHLSYQHCHMGTVSAGFSYCPCFHWSYADEEAGVSQLMPGEPYCWPVRG